MKLVDHPNLVSLIQAFEDDKNWLLIMDLMEPEDLLDILLQKQTVSE
jgi:serine/threonine protein kinase